MTNMRRGFTMIELIFVIVIIGILAAVAIPKLSATRDDAKIAKSVANLKTCVNDVGAAYTAVGNIIPTTIASCKAVNLDTCFSVPADDLNSTTPAGQLIISLGANSDDWCTNATNGAQWAAAQQDLNGTHLFGGSRVTR